MNRRDDTTDFRPAPGIWGLARCKYCGGEATLWQERITADVWHSFGACETGEHVDGNACPFYLPPATFVHARKSDAMRHWNMLHRFDPRRGCEPAHADPASPVPLNLESLQLIVARLRDAKSPAAALVAWAAAEIEEHDHSLEIRWKADMRAITRWRVAHPGNDLESPDHADLCVWLLGEQEKADPSPVEIQTGIPR